MKNNYLLLTTIIGFLTFSVSFGQSGCSDLDITSVQDGSVCGPGRVELKATPSGNGDEVVWFESDDTTNDTIPLYVGEEFLTPEISSTTSYWVSEALGTASVGSVGPATPADASSSGSNTSSSSYAMIFDVHQPTTLVSVDVYPSSSGSQASIEILDSSGNVLETVNYTTSASSSDGSQAQTVTLNVHLDPGTDYEMKQGNSVSMYRNSSGVSYPFTSPFIDITDNSFSSGYYYYFYNWEYEDIQLDCESSREEVVATVNDVADEEVVSPFPYVHKASTQDYVNNYEGEPGTDCGSSENYLDGYDVVYHFNADDDYVMEVELDSLSHDFSAVFVYNDCDDIGDVCAEEGSVAEDSADKHGFEFIAEDGKDYYFVVSSAEVADSLDYQLNINRMGCSDIPTPTAEETDPYFITGDSLMALETKLKGSKFNEGYRWYEDSALQNEIMRPDTVSIAEKDYYITQTVIGCQSDALKITPIEFHCSDLNPDIITPVIELCIPGGYVSLEAQPSPAGTHVYWYDSETADDPISKEGELDVGYVSDSTSYWVSELRIEEVAPQDGFGKVEPTGTSSYGSTLNYGLEFDVDEDFDLVSVDVYPDEDGEVEISLFDSSGNLIDSATKTVSSGGNAETIPLDFRIEEGTGYRLLQTSSPSLDLIRDTSNNDYPYDIGDDGDYGEITNGTYGATGTLNSSSYYYFYNWTVGAGNVICESDKKEVNINITDNFPDVPKVNSPYIFCGDEDFTIGDIEVDGGNLQWYDEGGNILADSTMVQDEETYYVAVQESGGCMSDIVPVNVLIQDFSDQPEAEAEQKFNPGDVLASLEVSGVNLRWYADAEKEEELPNNTELVDETTYYVTQTRVGFCESEVFAITVSEELGVEQQEFEKLTYAPNPVEGFLYVKNPEGIDTIEVYDLTGKKLEVSVSYNGNSEVKLDFTQFSAGTYFMRVGVDGKTKTVQLSKK